MYMKKVFLSVRLSFLPLCFLCAFLASGCKSQPVPADEPLPAAVQQALPSFALALKDIEADDPSLLRAFLALETVGRIPPGADTATMKIASWKIDIDGQDAGTALSVDYPRGNFSARDSIPLRLDIDIDALAAKGMAPKDDYNITLLAELDYSLSPAETPAKLLARGSLSFPGVRPPVFKITDIAVLQAELINTRFRVGLTIDNPNPFPIELSAFNYRLYGNGRFWADGRERNVLHVNGSSSLSGNVFLLMNFIDMDRNLLDQIIRLEDVNYRFEGDVDISTGVAYLPKFNDSFNLSGYSRVGK